MPVLQLPDKTVKLIRSTQAITSISSAVKELLENAIDAGATSIDIKLERYGLDKIQIEDNGSGINITDIRYVCLPHYTSKIYSFQDLKKLQSYGFRGEALNSLCTISNVRIISKTNDEQYGSCYTFDHNGNVVNEQPMARQNGTTVCVTDIFKNVPVRRQFYQSKKAANELKNLEKVVKCVSLIIPKIRVFLYHNKCVIWQKTSCETMLESITQLYPGLSMKHLNCVSLCNERVSIEMILPTKQCDLTSSTRISCDGIMFYVNKRPVNEQRINKMVQEEMNFAFPGKLPKNKCPVCVISISVKSDEVDFNLEPDKTRVLIKDFDNIINCIRENIAIHLNQDLYEKTTIKNDLQLPPKLNELPNSFPILKNNTETVNSKIISETNDGDMDFDELFGEAVKELDERAISGKLNKSNMTVSNLTQAESVIPQDASAYPKPQIDSQINRPPFNSSLVASYNITKSLQIKNPFLKDMENKENTAIVPSTTSNTINLSEWSRGIVSTKPQHQNGSQSQHQNGSFIIGPKINCPKEVVSKRLKPNSIGSYVEITSNRSVSSQMGKKELSGFTKFARDIRSEIIRDSPGISFTKVASRLAEEWKSLHEPQKENYIKIGGMNKTDEGPKKSGGPVQSNIKKFMKKTVASKISFNDIKRNMQKSRLENPFEYRMIKEIVWNGQSGLWLCCKGNEPGLINIHGLNELVVYHRNLQNMILPLNDCPRVCFIKRDLDALWSTLSSLPKNEFSIITDKVVITNGFKLRLIKDNALEVLQCYDQVLILERIKQLLQFIVEPETECRPPFAIQYIMEETLKICNETLVSSDETVISSLVKYWQQCIPDAHFCLHNKSIFMSLKE